MSDANSGLCLLIYIIGGHLNILYLDLSIAFWGWQVEHVIYSLVGDMGWHSLDFLAAATFWGSPRLDWIEDRAVFCQVCEVL